MSSPNKARGTRWESAVRDFFLGRRMKAYRPAQSGSADVGDVHVNSLVALQCKDVVKSEYSKWIADANEQADCAGLPFGAVVHKRRQRSVGDSYVVMDLDSFSALIRRLSVAEEVLQVSNARWSYEKTLDYWDTDPVGP